MKQVILKIITITLLALPLAARSESDALSGIYEDGPANKIEFKAGGKAYITADGTNELAFSYKVDGERVIFSGPQGNFVGHITAQGIQCEGHLYHKR